MSDNNLYRPPQAHVADITAGGDGYQPINFFSAKGRLSRLQLLSYGMAINLVLGIALAIVAGILGAFAPVLAIIVTVIAYVAIFVVQIMLYIQRSHDMNWSAWMLLWALIPLVGLIWLLKAGTVGANNYGPPPPPNSTFVKVVAWLTLGLMVLSLIGLIAMWGVMGAAFMGAMGGG